MADRKHGVAAPPTETTIRSRDWEFRDLEREAFHRVQFVDVDLT